MPGGVHADHGHVEWYLGTTFSASSKPFTDAHIDAMCVAAEQLIATMLEPGITLPATVDTGWRQIVVELVINMMERADKWQRARGATTESSESTGSATFADFAATVLTPPMIARIKNYERNLTSAGGASYGDTVSTY